MRTSLLLLAAAAAAVALVFSAGKVEAQTTKFPTRFPTNYPTVTKFPTKFPTARHYASKEVEQPISYTT